MEAMGAMRARGAKKEGRRTLGSKIASRGETIDGSLIKKPVKA